MLVVEDAHWADEGSLDVVRLLARRVPTSSSLVVITYRDDELERDHPLRIALGDISTAAVERVPVRALCAAPARDCCVPRPRPPLPPWPCGA